MKIGLIYPPLHKEVREFTPPLGLAYIASYLEKSGYPSEIIDANACKKDINTLARELAGRFAIIGISVITIAVPMVIELISHLKRKDAKVKVVLGGIHPTVAYDSLLRMSPYIDAVVIGEGEATFLEIIKSYEGEREIFKDKEKLKAIDGIAFRDNDSDKIVRSRERELIKDLDTIPFPAFEKLPMKRYAPPASRNIGTAKGKTGFMVTARGCPWRCTFCASPALWSRFRYRSAENIIEEIKSLIKLYDIRQIDFQDDTLTAIPERIDKICDFIIDSKIKLKWNGFARVSDVKDRERLKKMRKAGCYELQFGIESADQGILDLSHKRIKVEDTVRAIRLCHDVGIKTLGYFIIGLPGETRKTAEKTIAFAKALDLDLAAFYILLPYPGTPVYNDLVRGSRIGGSFIVDFAKNYSVFKNPVISSCELSIMELRKFRSRAIRQFYFSKRFISKTVNGLLKSPMNVFPLVQILKEFYYLGNEIIFKGFKGENG